MRKINREKGYSLAYKVCKAYASDASMSAKYVSKYVCKYVCVYVCMYASMQVCMHALHELIPSLELFWTTITASYNNNPRHH